MTVSTTSVSVTYTANGATTAFAVSFPFFEIAVDLVVISSGATTRQVAGTDYTITGGDGATGTITFTTAPATGYYVWIRRDTTKLQETNYVEGDAFPAETHEDALDRLTMSVLELEEQVGRRLSYSANPAIGGSGTPYGAGNARISDLAEAEEDTDAVTLAQVRDLINDEAIAGVATEIPGWASLETFGAVPSVAITGATLANPCVITTGEAHGFTTGDTVWITSIVGLKSSAGVPSSPLNWNSYSVTVLSSTTFSVPVNTSALTVAYSSGGWASKTDNKTAISDALSYAKDWHDEKGSRLSLLIPPRHYHTTEVVAFKDPIIVHGHGCSFDNTVWYADQDVEVYGLTVGGATYNGHVWARLQAGTAQQIQGINCGGFGGLIGGYYRSQVAIGAVREQWYNANHSGGWGISVGIRGMTCVVPPDAADIFFNDPGSIVAGGTGYTDGWHTVKFGNGKTATVTGITKANPGVVTTSAAHGLTTGRYVELESVGGMTEVNEVAYSVTVLTSTTFSIGVDTSSYGTYTSGGTMRSGKDAIGRIKVVSGVVTTCQPVFGGRHYETGDQLSITGYTYQISPVAGTVNIGAGSGFTYQVGDVTDDTTPNRNWSNSAQFYGTRVRSNWFHAIWGNRFQNMAYCSFYGTQCEGNLNVDDRATWYGEYDQCTIVDPHIVVASVASQGAGGTAKIVDFTGTSSSIVISGGRWTHVTSTMTTAGGYTVRDIANFGTNPVPRTTVVGASGSGISSQPNPSAVVSGPTAPSAGIITITGLQPVYNKITVLGSRISHDDTGTDRYFIVEASTDGGSTWPSTLSVRCSATHAAANTASVSVTIFNYSNQSATKIMQANGNFDSGATPTYVEHTTAGLINAVRMKASSGNLDGNSRMILISEI